MELYLKGVVLMGGAILPFGTHELQRILPDVVRIFAAFEWGWDFEVNGFRSLDDFRSVIRQLDAIKSDALRYPTLKDGKTAALESYFSFNLFDFCETLDPVYPILGGAAYGAHEELQLEYENNAPVPLYAAW